MRSIEAQERSGASSALVRVTRRQVDRFAKVYSGAPESRVPPILLAHLPAASPGGLSREASTPEVEVSVVWVCLPAKASTPEVRLLVV